MKEARSGLVHYRFQEVFAKESTKVTRDRALTMTKTSKKEKKGSITMRGRVEYKRKARSGAKRKEEKGAKTEQSFKEHT